MTFFLFICCINIYLKPFGEFGQTPPIPYLDLITFSFDEDNILRNKCWNEAFLFINIKIIINSIAWFI